MNQADLTSRLALNSRGSESLRQAARTDPIGVAKTVAKRFDAIFVNVVLRQMCDAPPQSEPLDSSSSKMYTSMLDQQLSQTMVSRGVGVVDRLLKQTLRQANHVNPNAGGKVNMALFNTTMTSTVLPGAAGATSDVAKTIARSPLNSMAIAVAPDTEDDGSGISTVPRPGLEERVQRVLATLRKRADTQAWNPSAPSEVDLSTVTLESRGECMSSFYNKLIDHTSQTAQETGVPASSMIDYVALESSWGRHEIKAEDGTNTYNLSDIKANGSWAGKAATVTAAECIGSVAHRIQEKLHVYSSYAEAFKDYTNLLANNPRYSNVMAVGDDDDAASFAEGLQRAGYVTDPNYACKIMAVFKQIA